MRRLAAVLKFGLVTALAASLSSSAGLAARDDGPPAAAATPFELVMFEADGCIYCEVFRRDVLPLYKDSQTSREAPLRFVNLTTSDESRMGLAAAITIAPTIVLFRDGAEVDRIVGYTGPFNFVKLVNIMMDKHNDE